MNSQHLGMTELWGVTSSSPSLGDFSQLFLPTPAPLVV